MVKAEYIIEAIQPWLMIGDVYLFLEAIHPFESEDTMVLDELRESVEYWQKALS
jgi:hypothetical protein